MSLIFWGIMNECSGSVYSSGVGVVTRDVSSVTGRFADEKPICGRSFRRLVIFA